ncbi:hypothetical protein EMIHUDRAFT_205120 [Emiliania huxleyi CCMP1516]|uniref:RBR-type E3 ubiquitin transferase n=2 Tax=Emiliania huxleyi TaxID=2903 RepID=A0A0D3JUH9_EMIH1|nr:hypothetical protein EMIHUDRAFT_205120 [Emiliania huxleyi CCMP1516]EOD27164.1 hypothetical protein EMIHUDRAFT_205120 [Emiliania huxleyi CCMP1516]|eukprot:XP_005779593.1 hypothetical protein EMIHUDRAFT_205120 [Emiliania huxleyi CCMP1516]
MAAGSSTQECASCFDTAPLSPLCASSAHGLCAECCWRCCESSLGEGLVPACPFKDQKCGAVSKRRALTALDAAQLPPSQRETFASKLDEVYLGAERARRGAVQCIGKGCEEWYVPPVPHSDRPQRLECSRRACGAVFCSACRQPFHVRSTCAEALRLSARWVRFLQDELAPFLQAAVRLDGERWSPALAAHAQAKGSLDDATRDALSRFDELRRMELWKQAHCKRCPHCRRVVEKMEGCDMLVCGSDAHGGNQQRGCGKPFVWCEGQPNSALNGCDDPVVGPRLQCVQCEVPVELCVKCVAWAGGGSRRLQLHDGRTHPRQHIFRRVRPVMSHGGASSALAPGEDLVEVIDLDEE